MNSTRERKPGHAPPGSGLVQQHHHNGFYPYRLNFYDIPPTHDITLEQFESTALSRLRILFEIEASFIRNKTFEESKNDILKKCQIHLPLHSNTAPGKDLDFERRNDHVSHYVLRLAFCRTEELRRRFIKAEMTLFRMRFENDDTYERQKFLDSREFGWKGITAEEKELLRDDLLSLFPDKPQDLYSKAVRFNEERFYKVNWTRVPDLIENRRVILKNGFAYIASGAQSSVVFQEFHDKLEKALELTAKALPRLDEDDRLIPILDHLARGFMAGVPSEYIAVEGEGIGESVTANMIDGLSRNHFPLCMRTLHDSLKKDRHLPHYARLQYGLFLKALGLSIEEAIVFWRRSFTGGKITEDVFNKEHRYNIRHSYGLEGRRTNYPAKSCHRILLYDQPGASDPHGCPFAHYAEGNLQSLLLSTTWSSGSCITSADLPEIMTAVKNTQYPSACTRVFEITHGIKKGEGLGDCETVLHPNMYAARSRELERQRTAGSEKADVEMEIIA